METAREMNNLLREMKTPREMYNLLRETYPKADAIYEDAIIELIGNDGLLTLRESKLIEGCGSINNRKLYAI